MLRITLPICLLLPLLAGAQEDMYGKSEAQILGMGQKRWNDFFQAKAGPSTASMARMNEIFGLAARHRNDPLLIKATATLRQRVLKLRMLMSVYANHAIDIGENIVGGGTMWIPVYANVEADTEMALFGLLGGQAEKPQPATVSGVKKWLAELSKTIEKTHADHDADSFFKYPEARASLVAMRTGLTQIAAIAKHLDRENSDRVLSFCRNYVRTAKDEWN